MSAAGAVRVIHVSASAEDTRGETIVRIDRTNPILGNQHVLHSKLDDQARAEVIAAYREDLEADIRSGGPMLAALMQIVRTMLAGQDVALACHCAPLPCHGDVLADHARRIVASLRSYAFHQDGTAPADGVFVFGSNLASRHGKGAALLAKQRYGARGGIGYGPSGNSYAIPTKDAALGVLTIAAIRRYVVDFLNYARLHPEQRFFVSRIGCGLAGYADADIAPLFLGAPGNCSFAEPWSALLSCPDAALPAYAGIGSRATPPAVLGLMTRVAERLQVRGYLLRSGGALGADTAFESGAGLSREIFLPWRNFNKNESPLFEPSPAAFELAASLHPAWSRLDDKARCLMARNCHQILGLDLRSPVGFVACWTEDGCESEAERSPRTGGTGQAIALASRHGIPVINFARPQALDRIKALLQKIEGGEPLVPPSHADWVASMKSLFPGARVAAVRVR